MYFFGLPSRSSDFGFDRSTLEVIFTLTVLTAAISPLGQPIHDHTAFSCSSNSQTQSLEVLRPMHAIRIEVKTFNRPDHTH